MKRFILSLYLVLATLTFVFAQVSGNTIVQEQRLDISKTVKVFPNPAIDYVYVKLESAKAEEVKVVLHNIIGNPMTVEIEVVAPHELRVRVKDLAAGYYLLAIKDDATGLQGTYKVLKR